MKMKNLDLFYNKDEVTFLSQSKEDRIQKFKKYKLEIRNLKKSQLFAEFYIRSIWRR